ncbi:MAG: carbonic anhydrase [Phycisphaerales bacterium]
MSRSHLPRNVIVGSFVAGAVFAFAGRALSATTSPDNHAAPSAAKVPAATSKPKAAPAMGKVTNKPEAVKHAEAPIPPTPSEKPTPDTKHADAHQGPAGGEKVQTPSASEALAWLEEGNARWVSNSSQNPNISGERRGEVAAGQHPFVTVLTCADSRLPVERLFDRGVGDVFVIRVAGNVAGGSETGTIEYGVGHLHTPLLIVMGHTKCGAVAAAATNAQLHGKVAELVSHIKPAVDRARKNNPEANADTLTALAVKENVWQSIFDLYKSSDELRQFAANGKVKVIGAVCDISTGKVEFLGEHPWQAALLNALDTDNNKATANADDEKH